MKKRIIVALLLLVIFACGFIPVTRSESFKIDASYYNVYRQFTSPKNWLTWQRDLKEKANENNIKIDSNRSGFQIAVPSLLFDLQNMGMGNFAVSQTQGNSFNNYSCILIPENKSNKTIALVTRKTNVFGWIGAFIKKDEKQSPIAQLKTFMEDPRLYYGFIIKKELTSEKLIAVIKGAFLNTDLYQKGDSMLDQLNGFILKNKLEIIAPLQLQYVESKKDSVQIMLGFPVNKKVMTANDIEYMTMPKGRVLVGYFNGPYKFKDKLYNAMRQYMNDNYIHPMIQPFERFDDNKLPAVDSEAVDMQLIIPYM